MESTPIAFLFNSLRFMHISSNSGPVLVTGGAGFIGSNYVLAQVKAGRQIINLDLLSYAGNLGNLASLEGNPSHRFVRGSIGDATLLRQLFQEHQPIAIVHFAAESHVDRSIHGPEAFVQTNVLGTFQLLEAARAYWSNLGDAAKEQFRFLHVSTDEVYGTLEKAAPAFAETHPYQPNSPYAASKAASDHLVRAYHHTYGLPTLTTNCSNNYGPYQFPEKLIPLVINRALAGQPLPIYGDGQQVRDWLFVGDHCEAIAAVLASGRLGETYNIGGHNEKTNLEVVHSICALLDELRPRTDGTPYASLVTFVKDRPGHDRRYAIDASKIERELGWRPKESFETGLRKTVQWYLKHEQWVADVTTGAYQTWVEKQYQ